MKRNTMSKSFFSHFLKINLFVLIIIVLSLACCGKRGNPLPPEDVSETFPAIYPPAEE